MAVGDPEGSDWVGQCASHTFAAGRALHADSILTDGVVLIVGTGDAGFVPDYRVGLEPRRVVSRNPVAWPSPSREFRHVTSQAVDDAITFLDEENEPILAVEVATGGIQIHIWWLANAYGVHPGALLPVDVVLTSSAVPPNVTKRWTPSTPTPNSETRWRNPVPGSSPERGKIEGR